MREINKFLFLILILVLLPSSTYSENFNNKILSIGNSESKVIVKIFSSLTCPHCANFHEKIFEDLKKDYIDKGLVKFEHHGFPLDLAALNAEIIIRCHSNNIKRFQLLGEIYKKQNQWAVGSDINLINDSIKKIGLKFGLDDLKMNKCLKNEKVQDQILNERIEAQKKYKIQSTPTILINEKKFEGQHNYELFKKVIEKNL